MVSASQTAEPVAAVIPGVAAEDVSMAAPALRGAPAAVTPFPEDFEEVEATAKRQKMSMRSVGNEELCHMDVELHEHLDQHADADILDNWVDDDNELSGLDDDLSGMIEGDFSEGMNAETVWRPYSEMQPELPADELHLIDLEAGKIEIQRLLSMV